MGSTVPDIVGYVFLNFFVSDNVYKIFFKMISTVLDIVGG